MGSWNIPSLSEDHLLPHQPDKFSRLRVDIVGLFKTRRPGSCEISSRGFTYNWSGMSNGAHLRGVAIGIFNRLQPSVVEVTLIDEGIM